MNVWVIDASVGLAFYLPAEPYKAQALSLLADYTAGAIDLVVPTLISYEIIHVLSRAVRGVKKKQILTHDQAEAILKAWTRLNLEKYPLDGLEHRVLAIAETHQRSGYDAAYLALAEHLGAGLMTGDERFYRAMHDEFPQVHFIAHYRAISSGEIPSSLDHG